MTDRVPHISKKPPPWESAPARPAILTEPDDPVKRAWSYTTVCWAMLAMLFAAVLLGTTLHGHQKIPNHGQLMQAARAYATIQADNESVTALDQKVVSVKIRSDGTVAVVVHMKVRGVNHKGTIDGVAIMKRSLWRGVSFRVLHTHVTR